MKSAVFIYSNGAHACAAIPIVNRTYGMAASCQIIDDLFTDAGLDNHVVVRSMRVNRIHPPLGMAPSRRVNCLIHVETMVEKRRDYLHIHLHLCIGPWGPATQLEPAVVSERSGKNHHRVHRVTNPLAGPKLIGMAGIEMPIIHSIV